MVLDRHHSQDLQTTGTRHNHQGTPPESLVTSSENSLANNTYAYIRWFHPEERVSLHVRVQQVRICCHENIYQYQATKTSHSKKMLFSNKIILTRIILLLYIFYSY